MKYPKQSKSQTESRMVGVWEMESYFLIGTVSVLQHEDFWRKMVWMAAQIV